MALVDLVLPGWSGIPGFHDSMLMMRGVIQFPVHGQEAVGYLRYPHGNGWSNGKSWEFCAVVGGAEQQIEPISRNSSFPGRQGELNPVIFPEHCNTIRGHFQQLFQGPPPTIFHVEFLALSGAHNSVNPPCLSLPSLTWVGSPCATDLGFFGI